MVREARVALAEIALHGVSEITEMKSIADIDAIIGGDRIESIDLHRRTTHAFTGVRRNSYVIQIGGATTIYETKEAMLDHLPFPAEPGSPAYGMLFGHLVALQTYRASNIRWTVLTPPAEIDGWSMGAKTVLNRTGKYRTSTAGLVEDASGKSVVNVADLAVAAVDEAEKQRFVGKRFTIGY
jgi:hypothetical protein